MKFHTIHYHSGRSYKIKIFLKEEKLYGIHLFINSTMALNPSMAYFSEIYSSIFKPKALSKNLYTLILKKNKLKISTSAYSFK